MRQPAEDLGPRAHRTISRILDAARQAFLTAGYSGTTIDEIARRAEVSRASVYTYFPSKRDIMLAAGAQSSTESEALIDRVPEMIVSEEGTIAWVAEYFTFLEVQGSFAFAWTQAAHDDEEIRTAGMKRHLNTCARLGKALAAVRDADVPDPTALGLIAMSMMERSWNYSALYGPGMDAERLHLNIGKILWSSLRRLDTAAAASSR
jgi:AcrR family transcriptional regulator